MIDFKIKKVEYPGCIIFNINNSRFISWRLFVNLKYFCNFNNEFDNSGIKLIKYLKCKKK